MLLNELKVRLKTEFEAYRLYLTNADLSAEELFNKAYEIASKREIMELFNNIVDLEGRYTDEMVSFVLKKSNALDYLYNVWLHTDFLIVSEFANLLYDELLIRKRGADE